MASQQILQRIWAPEACGDKGRGGWRKGRIAVHTHTNKPQWEWCTRAAELKARASLNYYSPLAWKYWHGNTGPINSLRINKCMNGLRGWFLDGGIYHHQQEAALYPPANNETWRQCSVSQARSSPTDCLPTAAFPTDLNCVCGDTESERVDATIRKSWAFTLRRFLLLWMDSPGQLSALGL